MTEYYKIGRDSFGITQYRERQPTVPVRRCTTPAVSKMPEQLERWGRIEREKRQRKEQANYERQRPMVCNDIQVYKALIEFLTFAVERGDDERARYWSKVAFSYVGLPTKPTIEQE